MTIQSRFRRGPLRTHQHDMTEGSTAPDRPASQPSATGGGSGGVLGLIEWIGNKLPDPAFLFLGGAILVIIVSGFVAPDLPDRWAVEFDNLQSIKDGGVDQHKSVIRRHKYDESGEPMYEKKKLPDGTLVSDLTKPIMEVAEFKVVEGENGPEAHLVNLDTNQPVVDASGHPIDFAERGWAVFEKRPVQQTDPETGEPVVDEDGNEVLTLEPTGKVFIATALTTSNGLYWSLKTMVNNFMGFAPLGVVLVGMLGIGVAEKTGLIAALLRLFMKNVPNAVLTPAMVFIGIMSSIATDAGYVVLPPLAAAIYLAAGRSPLVGIAAVFAGVAAGFNANLFITSLEPLMSNLSDQAAKQVDPERAVAATSNWYFLAVSTVVITFAGWLATALFVEKRLSKKSASDGGPDAAAANAEAEKGELTPLERKGAFAAIAVFVALIAGILALVNITGSPLHGQDGVFPRWVDAIVPLMFFCFILPGITYGAIVGNTRTTKDAAKHMMDSMAGMAPIIVLAFFAGQFIAYFAESNLGNMLAFSGGEWLFNQGLSAIPLILAFIVLTMVFNLFVGSMSAKYTLFAPIFIPMFMLIGIRPELTQVAYRIGDSVTNIITPLNAYLIIVLVFMQKYAPKAGMGTLIAMMLPYTFVFAIAWSILLVIWMLLGIPLGPGDPMVAIPVTG
ncbi:MAG: AbgT family transporter [Phycisphaerales bacterium JB050]